jgi:hypothetical protein
MTDLAERPRVLSAASRSILSSDAYVGATKLWRQHTIKEWAASRPRKPGKGRK